MELLTKLWYFYVDEWQRTVETRNGTDDEHEKAVVVEVSDMVT